MKCNHCGHEMPEGARFCAGCGNEMTAAPSQPTPQQTEPQQNSQTEPEQSVIQVPQPQTQPVGNPQTDIPIAPPPLGSAENDTVFISNAQTPPENGSFGYAPPVQQPVQQPMPPYMPPNQPMYAQSQVQEDKKSIGLNILGFMVPLVGIILWAVNKKDKPIQSKSIIHSAIGGMVTALALSIVAVLVTVLGTFAIIGGVANSAPQGKDSIHYEESLTDSSADDETGGSANESTNDSANKGTGKIDWTSFEMSIGGRSVILPCSYEEFTNITGFKMDGNQPVETLGKGEYTTVSCKDEQGNTIYVKVFNDTEKAEKEKSTSDMTLRVVGIDVDADYCSKEVSTCLGISMGDTWSVSTFIEKCGQPFYEYDGSNGYASRQWDDKNDVYNDFEIATFDGKVVEEIDVSCFGD